MLVPHCMRALLLDRWPECMLLCFVPLDCPINACSTSTLQFGIFIRQESVGGAGHPTHCCIMQSYAKHAA